MADGERHLVVWCGQMGETPAKARLRRIVGPVRLRPKSGDREEAKAMLAISSTWFSAVGFAALMHGR